MKITERDFYEYVKKHPACTRTQIRSALCLNERVCAQYANRFLRDGIIRKQGGVPHRYIVTGLPWKEVDETIDTERLVRY